MSSIPGPDMLDIRHLSVDYTQHGKTVRALNDFSLTISAGEAVGLVGASGSGKSTVALAVLRLIRPQEGRITSGEIVFEGRDLLKIPEPQMQSIRGRQISMVFQDPFVSLNPVLTVRTQMLETLNDLPAAQKMLEQVQLEPKRVLSSYPHQLSGGQRQRVMIAMALLNRPKLLLADEPTTALDVIVQKDIMDLLFRLQKEYGLAMLFITHQLSLLKKRVSRVEEIRRGA